MSKAPKYIFVRDDELRPHYERSGDERQNAKNTEDARKAWEAIHLALTFYVVKFPEFTFTMIDVDWSTPVSRNVKRILASLGIEYREQL